jgi:hypothetical protein
MFPYVTDSLLQTGDYSDRATNDRVGRVMPYRFSQVSGYCEELFTISRSSGVKLL